MWLRALVFPEHVERHAEIEAACAIARAHPAPIERGDACARLGELAARAPSHATLCVYASMVLNQIPRAGRDRIRSALEELGRQRPTTLLTLDGTAGGWATLRRVRFGRGEPESETLGDAHAHGRWLAWQNQPRV